MRSQDRECPSDLVNYATLQGPTNHLFTTRTLPCPSWPEGWKKITDVYETGEERKQAPPSD